MKTSHVHEGPLLGHSNPPSGVDQIFAGTVKEEEPGGVRRQAAS
jgi:hypothetical protein